MLCTACESSCSTGSAAARSSPPPSEEDLRDIENLDWLLKDYHNRNELLDLCEGSMEEEAIAAGISTYAEPFPCSQSAPRFSEQSL